MPYASLEDALVLGTELERPFVCHAHDDHNASASVNALTGLFFCYTCGNGGKVDPSTVEISTEGLTRQMQKTFTAMDSDHRFSESWLNSFDAFTPGAYWLSRFSRETCRFYRLGTAPHVATYPMRDNAGRVMGVVTRDTTGERPQKYMYPPGVKNSQYLMDYHRVATPTVVLVEGMADVAAVYEAGYHVALGCYGARVSAAQARLLCKYDPARVLVAFDQDTAGEKGHGRVVDLLRGEGIRVDRLWWDTYKDLAEMPLEVRRQMLEQVLGHDSITTIDQRRLAG